jgi:cell filamentation protein
VRSIWDEDLGKWYFSILDVVSVLTDQPDYKKVRNYWKWLKNKLKEEGSSLFSEENEVVSNTNQLKLLAPDGKMRLTDVARNKKTVRRQSIRRKIIYA